MCAKGADWPSISMYIARIKCYLICFGERFFSESLGLRVANSPRIIRSSYCLDFVSPMLFINYFSYFDRCEDAVAI